MSCQFKRGRVAIERHEKQILGRVWQLARDMSGGDSLPPTIKKFYSSTLVTFYGDKSPFLLRSPNSLSVYFSIKTLPTLGAVNILGRLFEIVLHLVAFGKKSVMFTNNIEK